MPQREERADEDFYSWCGSAEFSYCLELLCKEEYDNASSALQIAYKAGHGRGYNKERIDVDG